MRIVSLVPSVTETLLDWDVEPVACTRFCEQPDLVHVGGTKNPDLDAIRALHPDVVVMEREENRREDYDELSGSGIDVLALSVRSVEDVDTALDALAARIGVTWSAPTLGQGPGHPDHSRDSSQPDHPDRPDRPAHRAFVPIWRRPYMALGQPTYGSALLARLGVDNVMSGGDGPYPAVTLETVAERKPDVVFAPSEPYPFGPRHRRELELVAPCVLVDGKDLFWWGTRTPGALDRLGRLIRAL